MTTSYIGNVESVISWGAGRYLASTASELAAADTVGRVLVSADEDVYADHYYSQIFRWDVELPDRQVIDFSEIYSRELDGYRGILVLRTAMLEIASAEEEIIMDKDRYQSLLEDPRINLVYDSSTVKALLRYNSRVKAE
jgi:hypothetical protein